MDPATHKELDLDQFLQVLRKYARLLAVFVALTVGGAVVTTWFQDHYFQSTARVLVDTETANVLEVQDVVRLGEGNYWSYKEYLQTQIQILSGRSLAEAVFQNLKVMERTRRELENSADQGFRATLKNRRRLLLNRFHRLVARLKGTPQRMDEADPDLYFYGGVLSDFRGRIDVQAVPDTRLIAITFEDKDPRFASEVANALAETYIQKNLEKKTHGAIDARIWLQKEYQNLQSKLDAGEARLQEFRESHDFLSADERREIINQKLLGQSAALTEARSRLAEYRKRYREAHPVMQQTLALVASLESAVRATRREAIEFEEKMIQFNALVRDVKFTQKLLENVIEREMETVISSTLGLNNLYLIETAEPALYPHRPKKKWIILLSGIFGLLGGVLCAFLIEALENRVQKPADFTSQGIPFLGYVPAIRLPLMKSSQIADAYLMLNNKGLISELFNHLRTSVLMSSQQKNQLKAKSLLVTSFQPGEGKTLITSNLALSLARFNYKVVLVEADIRKPRISGIFQLDHERGLSNYLKGEATLEEVVQPSKVKNLDIIVCGPSPENPSELLGGDRMKTLKTILESEYDIILYDSPPMFAVTDPVLLSRIIGHVIVVSRKNKTPKKLIPVLRDKLKETEAHIIGAIINYIREKDPGQGVDYRQYGKYYSTK